MGYFLSSVRVIVCYVEARADISGYTVNPSSHVSVTVALIFLKQISKTSPSNEDSSIYFTDKYPFNRRYLNGEVKTFVKTLTAGDIDIILISRTISDTFCNFHE